MCMGGPKIEAPPPPAQLQAMQNPKDMTATGVKKRSRRGMWASIFTSPSGTSTMPTVTGGGGVTGG